MTLKDSVKSVTQGLPHLVTGGVSPVRAGAGKLTSRQLDISRAKPLALTSPTFEDQERLPKVCAADGGNFNPELHWTGVPQTAQSVVLVVEDPDAPTAEPFVHWLVYGIPVTQTSLGVGPQGVLEGQSSMMKDGWTGCAPPRGDTPHHYHFQLFALDGLIDLDAGEGRGALLKAMKTAGPVVGFGELVGTYERPA